MTNEEDKTMQEAIYEYASFLYDLYIDSAQNDIIIDGQNNAAQTNINQFIDGSGSFFRPCIGLVQKAPSTFRKELL